ncbi:MAG: MFS transporter [Candidatus Zixiibacteriota bacterium]
MSVDWDSTPGRNIFGKTSRGVSDYWRHLQLFSRNVRLYLTASFLIGLTFAGYQLLLNLYLREQGAPESFIGNILSAGAVGMTLTSIPAAFILRRIRLKKILLISTSLYGLSILVLTNLPVTSVLIAVSFIAGIATTFYRVAAAPFFMRNTTPEERTYVFSLAFGVSLLASIFGSIIFGKMVTSLVAVTGGMISAYRWTFAVSIGMGLTSLIPFAMIKAADPASEDRKSIFSLSVLKKRAGLYSRLFLPYFIVGLGAGLIIPFLNLYFRDRFGQPPDKIGLFFTAVNATMFIGILAGPVLARKLGMVRSLVWTQLISIPFMVVLAYTYSLEMAFFAFLIRGALMNLGQPIGTNFGMEVVDESEQAFVNALFMFGWNSSWMLSAIVGGRLIEAYGYTIPLMITAGLYMLSSILYYTFFKRAERKTDNGFMVVMADNG